MGRDVCDFDPMASCFHDCDPCGPSPFEREEMHDRCLKCKSWDTHLPAADGNPYRPGGCRFGPLHEDDPICKKFFPLMPATGC